MNIRPFVIIFSLSLTACGVEKNVSSTFRKADSPQCVDSAMEQQFIVKHLDGTVNVVHAESEQVFLDGYLKQNEAQIEYAEHDYKVHVPSEVQAASANSGEVLVDNWGAIRIDADKMWTQNFYGAQVAVAVIDTGVDITHPQLQSQIFTNPGEFGPDGAGGRKESNGKDDDGNGYVDDYSGWNFVDNSPLTGDNQYHGSHVAGIIAAYHTDTVAKARTYVQGVAPKAKILPLAFLNGEGYGTLSSAVRAIQYAVSRGAKVINASWGGIQCSTTLRDEIASLAAKNIVFVNAAGNEGLNIDFNPEYPASLNLAAQITVGATGDHDYMAEFSNYGVKTVHLFAPGSNIVSTLPGNSMGFLSGTSMATPFVSGAVALLMSAAPAATIDQIRHALYNSALRNGGYLNASQGRMDLATAATELQRLMSQ